MSDRGVRSLIARYIRRQARQLARQFDGLRAADDIEFVHRARVASRRLGAALQVSEKAFPKRRLRRWKKAIHRMATSLGAARDRDVQIEFLCDVLSAPIAQERTLGVAGVFVEIEEERERLQSDVIAVERRLERKGILRQLRREAKKLIRGQADSGQDGSDAMAKAEMFRHIASRLDEMLGHAGSLAHPDDQQGHHAMRIAAKRLRYTMEVARPIASAQLEEPLEAVKRIQSLLGDVHDCDVWEGQLDAFAARQCRRVVKHFGHPGRLARLQPGIDYLRNDRRRHRQQIFAQLLSDWEKLGRQGTWDRLRAQVADPPPKARADAQSDDPCGGTARVGLGNQPPAEQLPEGNGSHHGEYTTTKPPLTVGSA